MKRFITITTACLLLTAATNTYAQQSGNAPAQPPAQTDGARDLYNTYGRNDNAPGATAPAATTAATTSTTSPAKGRPGAKLRIELDRGGRVRWVSPKTVFQAGDKVRFHFAMNFPGYVAIINEGSSGKRSLLFPYEGTSNHIGRTADYTVPQGEAWFEFDQTAGEERLTFIMSKREIQEVTQLTATSAPTATGNGNQATTMPVANTPHPATSAPTAPAATSNNGDNNNSNQQSHANTPAAAPQTEEQEILAALNSRALAGGRDLNVVLNREEGYVLASDAALEKPIGFKLVLKHR